MRLLPSDLKPWFSSRFHAQYFSSLATCIHLDKGNCSPHVDQRYRAYFHHSESRTIRHYSAAEVDDMGWAPVWPVSFICTTFRHSAERVRLTGGIEGQNTMTQIITTTDPQPNFSAEHSTNIPLYSTASLYMYTLLEYNRFHASEPATSLV